MIDIAAAVRKLAAEASGRPEHEIETTQRLAEDLGLDSLDVVEILVRAETLLGFAVDEPDPVPATVGELVAWVRRSSEPLPLRRLAFSGVDLAAAPLEAAVNADAARDAVSVVVLARGTKLPLELLVDPRLPFAERQALALNVVRRLGRDSAPLPQR